MTQHEGDPRQHSHPPMQGWQPVDAPPPPQNQRSWARRHPLLTGFGALVLLAVVVQVVNGGGGSDPTQPQPVAASQAAPQDGARPAADGQTQPEQTPGLGTPVRDGKFEFTVTKVDRGVRQVGGDLLGEKAQGRFVLVHVTVTNIGDQAQLLDDTSQTLRDTKGREFDADSMAAMSIDGNDVFLNEINPGNTVKGVLVYDMPKDAVPASIELHDSMFSGGVTVSLR